MLSPEGTIIQAIKMPETETDVYNALASIWMDVEIAYLEEVASRPDQGVHSVFEFGKGYGGLRMALVACRIPFETVRPQVWQHRMKCMTKGDKRISKQRAQALWPDQKMTHAIADSLLIAEFSRRCRLRIFE